MATAQQVKCEEAFNRMKNAFAEAGKACEKFDTVLEELEKIMKKAKKGGK